MAKVLRQRQSGLAGPGAALVLKSTTLSGMHLISCQLRIHMIAAADAASLSTAGRQLIRQQVRVLRRTCGTFKLAADVAPIFEASASACGGAIVHKHLCVRLGKLVQSLPSPCCKAVVCYICVCSPAAPFMLRRKACPKRHMYRPLSRNYCCGAACPAFQARDRGCKIGSTQLRCNGRQCIPRQLI
jgi:hypothetical protein